MHRKGTYRELKNIKWFKMKRKVAFKTLGCRLNQFETDALATEFQNGNYEVVGFNDKADVYVVNTCTVTNQSDHKSRNLVSQAIRKDDNPVVVVTGCMVNNDKQALEERHDITYVVDNAQKSSIFPLIDGHFHGEIMQPGSFEPDLFNFEPATRGFHTRSSIKIQDGCDNFCTFCIIPKVRGRATSRPVNEIIQNIKQVLALGSKEIVLTGVNIGRYHFDGVGFEDLLELILELPGEFRVRISSIEPEGIGEKFYSLVNHPKLCPHLHLCLQSGSDKILLQMRRMYNLASYKSMVENIRKNKANFNFTTDIIVGFPGETEEDFNETCRIASKLEFSHIHTFKFSVRKGTRAERMPEQIPEQIKTKRSQIIRSISDNNKVKYRNKFIGRKEKVLIEKVRNGEATGYSQYFNPFKIYTQHIQKNTFVEVHSSGIRHEKGDIFMIAPNTDKKYHTKIS